MTRLSRTLNRAVRPFVALVLVFAQVVGAFGFPIVQAGKTIKACGCVTPCGATSENCCCAKTIAAPVEETKRAGCAKCCDKGTSNSPLDSAAADETPTVKWVAGFKAKQCRGESPMGVLAEVPAIPPVFASELPTTPIVVEMLTISDLNLTSHFTIPLDPPPRLV